MMNRTLLRRLGADLRATVTAALVALSLLLVFGGELRAEYGDVVMNNLSEEAGMRPVVFPHWFHRIRYRCNVCHGDLGFEFKAGGNDIDMLGIIEGQYCGACHNGSIAWGVENCNVCHTGKPGTVTQVYGGGLQPLTAPAGP